MLADAGCGAVEVNVVQPVGISGDDAKTMTPLTMENIADAVHREGLADVAEIEALVSELYALARDARSVMSLPRVVQAWGYRTSRSDMEGRRAV